MANRQTLILDGTDIATQGVKLLDYSILNFGSFKDGGFHNVDGIDGVLDSSSSAMSALTGSITIIIEGITEQEVNATYRRFKQFLRSKSFFKISTKEDPNFYRLGKFLGEAEAGALTEVPSTANAWYITKIQIQFKDGYEYAKNEKAMTYSFTSAHGGFRLTNDGRPTRLLRVELSSNNVGNGYYRIESIGNGFLEFGTTGSLFSAGSRIILDLGKFEMIRIASNNAVTNMFAYIGNGTLFKIPNGQSTIKIQYKATENGSWSNTLPVSVKLFLQESYY